MKKFVISTLVVILTVSSGFSGSLEARENISQIAEETDEMYRPGAGAQDGAFTALSLSILGWGLGLAAAIAILTAVLHQSTGGGGSSHAHCH
jgi:hypothetical protein